VKIAIIGAGGYVFPLRLVGDLLSFPALQGGTLALMDIDAGRLERTAGAARELVAHHGLPARVEATTDRRRAVDGADAVIVTFQVGGLEAYRLDVEIPRRYGLDQTVGDTLGPGGVFRFLRSAPAYRELAADMAELCPGALLINYANPMAMSCWYLDRLGVETVGLCHSVQGTSRMLARSLDVPYEEVRFRAAGINHQAWFLEFARGDEDLYPRLRETMMRKHLRGSSLTGLAADHGDHSEADRGDSVYEGGGERVRTEIMAAFGYFHTESSHHASEYLPYFRKSAAMVRDFIPQRWDYYEVCAAHDADAQTADLLGRLKAELAPSLEYGAAIVNALATGEPTVVYGNVANRGLIPNLPDGCCVEVPCLVDANGVQPTVVGPLPPQCAAVNRTNVNVQELAVAAALTGDAAHVEQAVMLDPLTGALLTLGQIREMVAELMAAQATWLPPFATTPDGSVAAGAAPVLAGSA
jgi:alpha-galactosidase